MSSKNRGTPVDMSLPADQRGRKRQGKRIVATPPAQMDHGTSPRGRAQARRGEKWLAVQERLRADAANCAGCGIEVTDSGPGDFPVRPGGDEAVLQLDNVVVISRELSREMHDDAG